MAGRLTDFFKREIIFSVSAILAVISCFFVPPNPDYLGYINWDTIILLFVIMVIVEILRNLTVFELLVHKLLIKVKDTRGLVLFLVFTCFFSAIFITNDVSLIIFVPFSILALRKIDRTDLIILTVSLQTIAANVGCMVLPIGAPHNIVLYTVSKIPFESFFMILLPYIIVSVAFIIAVSLTVSKREVGMPEMEMVPFRREGFLKRVFSDVDYWLILTFIALFILIGNIRSVPALSLFLKRWIVGNEVFCGILSSQVISNVPAAMLLSGFSSNWESIIVGINIGGFGTLIASMANVISYKILVREFDGFKWRYLVVFTGLNVILLLLLIGVYLV